MAFGASLLVLANVVGVVFSGALTFLFGGFVPGITFSLGLGQVFRGLRWVVLAVLLMVFPLQWNGPGILSPPPEGSDVTGMVEEWAGVAEVISVDLQVDEGIANVDIVVASDRVLPSVEDLADDLSEALERDVNVELQRILAATSHASVVGD